MEQLILLLACAGMLLAILAGLACFALLRKLNEVTHKQQVLATDVDYQFQEIRQNLDAVAQQTAAQLQRFAQPRTQPQTAVPAPAGVAVAGAAAAAPTSARQSVTERRHRVLTLARRGLDVNDIAQTLGLPHGEVALIIRMSNPRFGD